MNRVTHAYLFSGTRGVGKTSIARIFAKCLNCVQGRPSNPVTNCDICQAIAVGAGRRRHRDRRCEQQRRRAGPRTPPERRTAAEPRAVQDLLHRRSPHALHRRVQCPAEDAGRAARARQVLLRDDRAEQDPDHGPLALPAIRFRGDHARADRRDPGRDLPLEEQSRPSPRRLRIDRPARRPVRCATRSRSWSNSFRRAEKRSRSSWSTSASAPRATSGCST